MCKRLRLFSISIITLFIPLSLFASTIHVPADQLTIQAGIDAAIDGDTVLVSHGTYIESINYNGKAITVVSVDGSAVTFLQPPNDFASTVTIRCDQFSEAVLRGFTVENGGDVNTVIMEGNGRSKIEYNVFRNNISGHINSLAVILTETSSIIERNLFYNNGGESVIRIDGPYDIYSFIINNTIDSNEGGIITISSYYFLLNNIITNNAGSSVNILFSGIEYNNLWGNGTGNCGGDNDICEDPLFVDPASHDYNLQEGSPCIDAGHPHGMYNDLDGTRNDMGAFPRLGYPLPMELSYGPSANGNIVYSIFPEIYWTYADFETFSQQGYHIQVGIDYDWSEINIWDSGPVESSEHRLLYTGPLLDDNTNYYFRLRLFNGETWGRWRTGWFRTHQHQVIHVPRDFPSIGAGMNYALDYDTVLVSPGTYIETIVFYGKNIVVKSEKGPLVTTIEAPFENIRTIYTGDDTDTAIVSPRTYTVRTNLPVVYFTHYEPKGAEISGFTITGGGYTGIYCDSSSPTITNNIIMGNSSIYNDFGAGIDLLQTSNSLIKGNIIRNNNAHTYGAAIHMRSCVDDTICYNVIYNNTGYGDVRCLYSNAFIYNNTIISATHSGILGQKEGFLDVRNNIIVGAPQYGIQVANFGQAVATYNCTWDCDAGGYGGLTPGIGAIYENPLFAYGPGADFNLLAGSPCIDAGDPNLFFNDSDGSRNDIGALSYHDCGDVNLDGEITVLDMTFLINYYFYNGPAPNM